MTRATAHAEYVESSCPNCRNSIAEIVATISSGNLERHFLECPCCHHRHVDSWSTLDAAQTGRFATPRP